MSEAKNAFLGMVAVAAALVGIAWGTTSFWSEKAACDDRGGQMVRTWEWGNGYVCMDVVKR